MQRQSSYQSAYNNTPPQPKPTAIFPSNGIDWNTGLPKP